MNIAITGVGGGVGQSIIKCLQKHHKLIGLDGEPLGVGLYSCNKSYIIPYAKDANFISKIDEICKKEKCGILFPGLDAELPVLSRAKFENLKVIVSQPDVVDICHDKLLTNTFLKANGFPVPSTYHLRDLKNELSYPFIIKPYDGARSQGVKLVNHPDDLSNINMDRFVAQEYIEGDEYTCGSLTLDGCYYGCIVMKRILRDGDTYKCFCVRNNTIENLIESVISKLNPFGPINFQLRMRDNIPYIFELNARCSGTTAARAMSGFNEPKMIVDYLIDGKKPKFKIRETCILRYWKEIAIPCPTLNKMKRDKEIINIDPFLL